MCDKNKLSTAAELRCVICGTETTNALVHKGKEKAPISMCGVCAENGYVKYYADEYAYIGGNS